MSYIAASLTLTDGRIIRFGGDETDTENVPSDISFDTSIPGGFGAASITLPKPANLYKDDAKLFSDVTVYGPGRKVLYEGYVVGVPQVGAGEIQLELAGWSTVLDRIQTFRQIFVDRDLSRWGEASRARRIAILAHTNSIEGPSAESDVESELPALTLTAEAGSSYPWREGWYDAGAGVAVESIYYDMTSLSLAAYVGQFQASVNDATATYAGSDLLTGTDSAASGTYTPTVPTRYGVITFYTTGTVSTKDQSMTLRRLAVFGDHGLTKRGTAPDEGYYGSDIVNYAIGQSPLNATLGDSIEETSFVIPHSAYYDDVSLTQVIEDMTILGGSQNVPNEWGVYEDRTFFWRSPGTYGRTWHVRRDEVATPSSEGPDADRRVAGVKVLYQDGAGTTLSVGPPGSNADYETSDLLDVDPDNPAHRIPGAYALESVGITTQQGAINIGTLVLNERNRLQWRGNVELQGEVLDANGNTYPVSEVRAGDQIVIDDSEDLSPRPVNATTYEHSSMSTSASIGARADTLEALLSQLSAVSERI